MKDKLARLVMPKGFACCPVLIHVNGVDDTLKENNYFCSIIDFGQLLDNVSS